ncbi:MAG TPA: zf-HC2 domain-containing protein, partial [Myxococcaceae bacterium]|nr:zf-HC2 domain-containing protein [Myxococcaceae bacterium]
MTGPAAHPDRSTLERLSRGELPADEAERVRRHAAGCSACSRALFQAATGAGDDGVTAQVPPPGEAQLAALKAEAPDALAQLPRGSSIGRYVVLDRVGSGGMGVVYAAYDPELDRRVAIKLLQSRSGGSGGSATSPSG